MADLARTVRTVRAEFSKVDELRAELASAHVTLERAQSDYRRRLTAGDSVSHEELAHANDAVTSARNDVDQTEGKLQGALASVQGTSVANNPDVLAAMARLRQASIVLAHMRLYAPVGGVVAQRSVQLGQQIAPGTPLMAVVPFDSVWIDANFKEAQLRNMRVGQPVTVMPTCMAAALPIMGKSSALAPVPAAPSRCFLRRTRRAIGSKSCSACPYASRSISRIYSEHPLRVGTFGGCQRGYQRHLRSGDRIDDGGAPDARGYGRRRQYGCGSADRADSQTERRVSGR